MLGRSIVHAQGWGESFVLCHSKVKKTGRFTARCKAGTCYVLVQILVWLPKQAVVAQAGSRRLGNG